MYLRNNVSVFLGSTRYYDELLAPQPGQRFPGIILQYKVVNSTVQYSKALLEIPLEKDPAYNNTSYEYDYRRSHLHNLLRIYNSGIVYLQELYMF